MALALPNHSNLVREKPRHPTTLSAANYEAEDIQKGPHVDSLGSRRSCLSIHQLAASHQLCVPPGRAEVLAGNGNLHRLQIFKREDLCRLADIPLKLPSRLQSDQTFFGCVFDQAGAVMNVQLAHQVELMCFDRFHTQ